MATRTPKIPARSTLLNSSLDGMDDLFDFKTKEDLSQPEQENGGTGITEMDFAVMEPLPNHKFKLYTGQRLWDMVDSIREFGILEPLIVWVHDGKNTILSGHNRQNAGSIAGLTKGPVIIRENLTYEDAILIATETNLRQRSFDDLSPSEKAYCLKQHYDATETLETLDKLAAKNHTTTSELVRGYVEKGLSIEGSREDIDFIARIIRQEITAVYHVDEIKAIADHDTDRLAKMLMKIGKINGAIFFLLIKVLMNLANEGSEDDFDQMLSEAVKLGVD